MKATFSLILLVLALAQVFAQTDDTRKKHYNLKKGIGLEGFDPVSYFDGRPTEGKSEIKAGYKGVTYLFSTQANRNKFNASPEKYEPAYGGWCAYAMGESGEKVKVNPETFKVMDGRLYLFYNFWGNNTLTDWNKNEKKLKEQGDKNWKKALQ